MLNRIVILLTLVSTAAAAGFYDTIITDNLYRLDKEVNNALDAGASLVGGMSMIAHTSYRHEYAQAILWSTREQAKAYYKKPVVQPQVNSTWRWW